MITQVDSNRDGAVDFKEFQTAIREALTVADLGREVDECFKLFDREMTGLIQVANFRNIMRHIGEPKLSDEDVDLMLLEAQEKDGKMDKANFEKICTCPIKQ